MPSKSITQFKHAIETIMARLQPLKTLMREDELEDLEYYESFDLANCAETKLLSSLFTRLTNIETRLLKKNSSKGFK